MLPKIVIVGRANVGKSTIFNKLLRKQKAIVFDKAGVTRDFNEEICQIIDNKCKLIDTGGFENIKNSEIQKEIQKQINYATNNADLCLFVVDARKGITAIDSEFAKIIRKKSLNTILLLNKAENIELQDLHLDEIHKLGFKDFLLFSAEHNIGFIDLYELITEKIDFGFYNYDNNGDDKPIKLSIIGRPNVGKSTFINNLLGEDRLITMDQPGITRDNIQIPFNYKNIKLELIDTAGIRKKSVLTEEIEKFSVEKSFKTIRLSHIVIFLIDATESHFVKQDLSLIKHCIDEGRVVLVAINKWDLIKKSDKLTIEELENLIKLELDYYKNSNLLKISALNNKEVKIVIDKAISLYEKWNLRIPTNKLNSLLEYLISNNPPKLYKGKPIKIKYITQVKSRPPTFMINCNYPDQLGESYIRYIRNSIQEIYEFENVPIRIKKNKNKNPYNRK